MSGQHQRLDDLQSHPEMAGRLLASFFEIAQIVNNRRLSPDGQLDRLLRVILRYLAVDHGSIMLLDKGRQLVVRAASRPVLLGVKQGLDDDTVAAWVARHHKPLFIPDISQDERFPRREHAYRTRSLLSVPLMNGPTLVGVINVTDRTGKADLLQDDLTCLLDFSGMVLSVVEQHRLLQAVKRQEATLKKRNEELRRHEAMRAELVKMLVHDLKGPLAEVVANLDILSYSVADENREFLEAAQIACERAVRMATNMVDVGKIEDGKLSLLLQPVQVPDLLEEALSAVKGLARIRGVALTLDVSPGLPLVRVDRVMILRVLQNLLTNALGHSPHGQEVILTARLTGGGRRLEVSVQDQGEGIPLEHQSHLFEKYARLTGYRDHLVGTGLGLYFCRLAVEAHRGRIAVDSAPGHGCRMMVSLPVHEGVPSARLGGGADA
ncbi:MAG: ATP-binding protein [Thermodesulfobacteriota bacterium]